jgi:beta-glucosidase
LARSISARTIVMLKNDRHALPLAGTIGRLCIIGPLADAAGEMRGPWPAAGEAANHISVIAGLRNALPGTQIVHAPGVAIDDDKQDGVAAALELCAGADAIILCLGEAAAMSGEAASRAHPGLPGQQRALAQAVIERAHRLGRPAIAILFSGRPLIVPWLAQQADALLAVWFPGCEAGNAIADVVTGRVSPSGRLPVTWPRALGQVPLFFAQRPGGRPANPEDHFTSKYLDVSNEPLYPFGYGLTYGRFSLANLRVTPDTVMETGTLEICVDVTNDGQRTAEESVFVFTRDKVASVARPLLELKAFRKISLQPGETGTLTISLPASQLRFLGRDLVPVFEPGDVEILVGPCADRTQLLIESIRLRS